MDRILAKLVIYKDFEKESVLMRLGEICACFRSGEYCAEQMVSRIYEQIHRILDIATRFGFDENLWHNYLAYLIATSENPFSITCETDIESGIIEASESGSDAEIKFATITWVPSAVEKG